VHRVFQTNALGSLARGIGVFTASVILAATNIIAGARDRDGMTGLIQCSNLKYVVRVAARPHSSFCTCSSMLSGGKYAGIFPCTDLQIGGDRVVDPMFAAYSDAQMLFYVGTAFGFISSSMLLLCRAILCNRGSFCRCSWCSSPADAACT
jgi:hypothetical protein